MPNSDTNIRRVTSVIIVGGGSSGWMTACLLNSRLNTQSGLNIDITLIEAPNIPTIGVGEATVPSIRRTLLSIGISEADFMRGTDATFKTLIRFENWNEGQSFDHPFDRRERPQTDAAVRHWLSERGQKGGMEFGQSFSILSNTSSRLLAPKAIGWPEYQSTFPYAYHLDAAKLGALLADFGTKNGIKRVLAKIQSVERNEMGNISKVVDENGQIYSADLYIDCTGFSARLAGKLAPETQDYSKHLICDHAATTSVSYDLYRPEHILPYTSASAKSAGWLWDINLQSRRSLGYVYSSNHITPEGAEAELIRGEGSHSDSLSIRHIKFKTYKRKKAWAGNCIAIGLSDGFVEPLESTGLYMMQFAAQSLADSLQLSPTVTEGTALQFNRLMQTLFEEIIGYVSLHYLTSARRDTSFWRDATDHERIPDGLKYLFEEWKRRPPHDMDMLSNHRLFSLESYEYLLFGMGFGGKPGGNVVATNFSLQDAIEKCYTKLPPHETWLKQSLM